MTVNISNPRVTQQILKKHGFTFKKSLGQNFLIEPNILNKIVEKAEIDKNTGVIEVGPGIGALTQKLAEKAGKVVALEIDDRLLPILEETLEQYENITVVKMDVLESSLTELIKSHLSEYKSIKMVANLPYYVTTPIVMKVLEEAKEIDSITIMIQKEVAARMSAKPGSKDYGSLTIAIEYYANSNIVFDVPSSVFIPRPKVDSSIVKLKRRTEPAVQVESEEYLFKVIKASFAQRRKTLYNNLVNNLIGKENKEVLEQLLMDINIDPKRRAETLTLEEFALLSNGLQKI